jgi:hypothetical protein
MFASSLAVPVSKPVDNYIQPTLDHALRIWWAFYWPTQLAAFFTMLPLNYAVKRVYGNSALPTEWLTWFLRIEPYLVTYTIALFVMRYILGKRFRHFRIALLPSAARGGQELLEATFERTLRVWWTYLWRNLALSLLGIVFVIYPAGMFVGLFNPAPVVAGLFFGLLGLVLNAALSLFVIYSSILDEQFDDFRVSLLPRHTPTGAPLGAAGVI